MLGLWVQFPPISHGVSIHPACDQQHYSDGTPACHAPCAPQLILRAINSSKSAFMAVTFNARFFESYSVLNASVVQAGILLKVRRWFWQCVHSNAALSCSAAPRLKACCNQRGS